MIEAILFAAVIGAAAYVAFRLVPPHMGVFG